MAIAQPFVIAQINKTYGQVVALADVSLNVAPGEFLTLLGPSGSGKTTLLMIIAGFVQPDSGSILVGGRELITAPPHRRGIGLVFQNYALFPHMTVAENIGFPLRYKRIAAAERRARVDSILGLVKLAGHGDRPVGSLSGGQRQRVALARALVFDPRLLLMDEPLSALDKGLREEMQVEIKRLHRAMGTTTVSVTHDQREALTMSDRIAVMQAGRVVQVGAPAEVYERPRNRFVAGFMGDSHFAPVEPAGTASVRLGGALLALARPLGCTDRPLHLLLRPEKLELAPLGTMADGCNALACEVRDVAYQGEQVLISAALETGDLVTVRRSTGAGTMRALPQPGARMTLLLHVEDSVAVSDE